jgi:phosphoserine phosphatase
MRLFERTLALAVVLAPMTTHAALPRGNWFDGNHRTISGWLPTAAAKKKSPIAVFDWDNTSMFKDIGDQAFRVQLDTLRFRLTPKDLAALLPEKVGEHVALHGVSLADVRADILAAYEQLWPAIAKNEQAKVLGTDAHKDFAAKMAWLSEALYSEPSIGPRFIYPWASRLFAGYTPAEVRAISADVCKLGVAEPLGTSERLSASKGRAGKLEARVQTGLRPVPEMQALMKALKEAGVSVRIVSASAEPLVQGAAATLGYPLEQAEIFGMRLELDASGKLTTQRPDEARYPTAYREGKVALIQKVLGSAPVLVAGDASTDYEMLTGFAETEVRIIVNRERPATEDIAKLYPVALALKLPAAPAAGKVATLLQGHDATTGMFIDSQRSKGD